MGTLWQKQDIEGEYFMQDLEDLKISPQAEFYANEQAAKSGNITAMLKVAELYEKGIGTAVNKKMAEYWRKQAGVGNI